MITFTIINKCNFLTLSRNIKNCTNHLNIMKHTLKLGADLKAFLDKNDCKTDFELIVQLIVDFYLSYTNIDPLMDECRRIAKEYQEC